MHTYSYYSLPILYLCSVALLLKGIVLDNCMHAVYKTNEYEHEYEFE